MARILVANSLECLSRRLEEDSSPLRAIGIHSAGVKALPQLQDPRPKLFRGKQPYYSNSPISLDRRHLRFRQAFEGPWALVFWFGGSRPRHRHPPQRSCPMAAERPSSHPRRRCLVWEPLVPSGRCHQPSSKELFAGLSMVSSSSNNGSLLDGWIMDYGNRCRARTNVW